MEDVEKILIKMIGTRTNLNQYNLMKMRACWEEIVGKNNASHCVPYKLDRRILTLQVDSSTWANQFLYYKLQIIKKINIFMGVDYVKDIKFLMSSEYRKNIKKFDYKSRNKEEKLILPSLTEEEKEAIALKFSHIKNENLRNAVISAEEKRFGLEKLCDEGKIKKCPLCGTFIKDNKNICFRCEQERQKKRETEIWKWVVKEPWIGWQEIRKVLKCDEFEFDMIKNDVKSYYFEKVRNKTADEREEKIAVQLIAGKPYALIREKERENMLKFLR